MSDALAFRLGRSCAIVYSALLFGDNSIFVRHQIFELLGGSPITPDGRRGLLMSNAASRQDLNPATGNFLVGSKTSPNRLLAHDVRQLAVSIFVLCFRLSGLAASLVLSRAGEPEIIFSVTEEVNSTRELIFAEPDLKTSAASKSA